MFQLTAGTPIPPIPTSWDWATKLPGSLGYMLNDQLGDCTCAGVGHLIQTLTANTSQMFTVPDKCILALYETVGGYNPADPSTDKGACMQDVLHYWQFQGVPRDTAESTWDKIITYVEVDPTNKLQVDRAIYELGGLYIGIDVQSTLMTSVDGQPGPVWSFDPTCTTSAGGHAIVLTGYDDATGLYNLLSWGAKYQVTYEYIQKLCDEAYGVVSKDFITAQGTTPLGLDLTDWQTVAKAIAA